MKKRGMNQHLEDCVFDVQTSMVLILKGCSNCKISFRGCKHQPETKYNILEHTPLFFGSCFVLWLSVVLTSVSGCCLLMLQCLLPSRLIGFKIQDPGNPKFHNISSLHRKNIPIK